MVAYPRIIIADERRAGIVAPSVMLVAALKHMGWPIRLFHVGVNESDIRLLKLATGCEVTLLDPFLLVSTRLLKTLFETAASPDCINILIAPLGSRQGDDPPIVSPCAAEMARTLECPMVPILFADSSAIIAARALENVLQQIQAAGANPCVGVLFASVLNPREYQLLETEAGRRSPLLCLGYLPQFLERKAPSLLQMCLPGAPGSALQIRMAVAQLAGMMDQVMWGAFEGFAKLASDWTAQPDIGARKAAGTEVVILSDDALGCEGDNARLLFEYFGCRVTEVPVRSGSFPGGSSLVYIPHGPAFPCADMLLGNENIRRGLTSMIRGRRPLFVNGGAAALFGETISVLGKDPLPGLGAGSYAGFLNAPDERVVKIDVLSRRDGIFLESGAKAKGYLPDYLRVAARGTVGGAQWSLRNPAKDIEVGESGWETGYTVLNPAYLELWSCPDAVLRWLTLRK